MPGFSLGSASCFVMTGMWRSAMPVTRFGIVLALVGGIQAAAVLSQNQIVGSERNFTIENDRFVKDGKPLQIISGRFDTFLALCKALYVPVASHHSSVL